MNGHKYEKKTKELISQYYSLVNYKDETKTKKALLKSAYRKKVINHTTISMISPEASIDVILDRCFNIDLAFHYGDKIVAIDVMKSGRGKDALLDKLKWIRFKNPFIKKVLKVDYHVVFSPSQFQDHQLFFNELQEVLEKAKMTEDKIAA